MLAVLALVLGGCVAAPDIQITGVDVVEVGEDTVELAIRIELHNRSDVPVKLDIWSYSLSAGESRYSGRWSAGLTVPPAQKSITSIPAVVSRTANAGEGCAWRADGSVTYLAPSRLAQILFEIGLNRPTTSFSGKGSTMAIGGPAPTGG